MKGFLRRPRALIFCVAFAPGLVAAIGAAPEIAAAQGYPSPYGYYPSPPTDEWGRDADFRVTRGFVATALARRGYRLVGPLREDQGAEDVDETRDDC